MRLTCEAGERVLRDPHNATPALWAGVVFMASEEPRESPVSDDVPLPGFDSSAPSSRPTLLRGVGMARGASYRPLAISETASVLTDLATSFIEPVPVAAPSREISTLTSEDTTPKGALSCRRLVNVHF